MFAPYGSRTGKTWPLQKKKGKSTMTKELKETENLLKKAYMMWENSGEIAEMGEVAGELNRLLNKIGMRSESGEFMERQAYAKKAESEAAGKLIEVMMKSLDERERAVIGGLFSAKNYKDSIELSFEISCEVSNVYRIKETALQKISDLFLG